MNVANPIATIWAGSMMLDEIGEEKSGALVIKAIEQLVKDKKVLPKDMGGTATTSDVGDEIVKIVTELNK